MVPVLLGFYTHQQVSIIIITIGLGRAVDPDPHGSAIFFWIPEKKIGEKNKKNLKLNLDQLHGFLLLSNLFCLFFQQ